MVFGRQTDQWVARMRSVKGVKVASIEPAELNMLHLNIKAKPLDDIRVRQAIAHAIDRKGMVQLLGDQVSREAVSVIPNGNLGTARWRCRPMTLPRPSSCWPRPAIPTA